MAVQTSYSHSELAQIWILSGGSAASADMAAAIAQAESGGCLYAKAGPVDDRPRKVCVYRKTSGEDSYGLWQINRDAHPQYSPASLYTPLGNGKAAAAIASGGASFSAWSTYMNGAYKQYLHAPVTATTGSTTAPPSGEAGSFASGHSGWGDLTHALATTLPTRLQHSRTLTRQALRRIR